MDDSCDNYNEENNCEPSVEEYDNQVENCQGENYAGDW